MPPPPRPRKPPVAWFSPPVLARAAIRAWFTSEVTGFADRRDLGGVPPAETTIDLAPPPGAPQRAVVHFVADVGDGYEATRRVADRIAARARAHGDVATRVLALGGDTVYPVASREEFDTRFLGPYRDAVDAAGGLGGDATQPPRALAIPGNHDWYDGLASFTGVFCQQADATYALPRIGGPDGWEQAQERSYWAARLLPGCWLWGVDTRLDDYVDPGQREYFERAARELGHGDDVLLLVPTPVWRKDPDGPGYENLCWFEDHFVTSRGATVVATLTGDHHHLNHYRPQQPDEPHRVVCGGGGAYTAPTHGLPELVQLPRAGETVPHALADDVTWPTPMRSRTLWWRGYWHMFRDKLFLLVMAVHLVMQLLAQSVALDHGGLGEDNVVDVFKNIFGAQTVLAAVFLFVAAIAYATGRPLIRLLRGTVLFAGQIGLGVLALWAAYAVFDRPMWWVDGARMLTATVASGLAGTLFMGVYLNAITALFPRSAGHHMNDWHCGMGSTVGKSFLEIVVTPDTITVTAERALDGDLKTRREHGWNSIELFTAARAAT